MRDRITTIVILSYSITLHRLSLVVNQGCKNQEFKEILKGFKVFFYVINVFSLPYFISTVALMLQCCVCLTSVVVCRL